MITTYEESILTDLNRVITDFKSDYNIRLVNSKQTKDVSSKIRKNEINLPLIALSIEYDYITDEIVQSYKTMDSNSQLWTYEIDYKETMPVKLNLCLTLLATDVRQIIDMETIFHNAYACVCNLTVDHPKLPDRKILFEIGIDKAKKIERMQGNVGAVDGTLYQSIIFLQCGNCVFFPQTYHPAQVAFDNSLQLTIMKRIVALTILRRYLSDELDKTRPIYFEMEHVSGTIPDSLKKVFEEQKKRAQEHITTPREQELEDKYNFIGTILDELHTWINNVVPYKGINHVKPVYQIMLENDCSVESAVEIHKKNIKKRQKEMEEEELREKKEAQQRAYQARCSEYNNVDEHSHFLENVFTTAAGIAIGNKVSNRGNKRKSGAGRQNLFGTASCQFGKRVGGTIVHCDISCPMLSYCTQRGRYKEGS